MQESVVLFGCRSFIDIFVSNVVLLNVFKKLVHFDLKCDFVHIVRTHKYERTCVLKEYAHFTTFLKILQSLQCSSRFSNA